MYLNNDNDIHSSSQCSFQGLNDCRLTQGDQTVSVKFESDIELEEELNLVITLSEFTQLHKIWVQGVNMYMGKTAVMIESSQVDDGLKAYHSKLFLGACSEPNMKWQMVVQIKNSELAIQSFFFNFETHY